MGGTYQASAQQASAYQISRAVEVGLGRFIGGRPASCTARSSPCAQGGFVVSGASPVGKRPRTLYAITDAGRRALSDWLQTTNPLRRMTWRDGLGLELNPRC